MIRILATALLALSLTASGAFATSMDDLVERDGLYYKKFTDKPFTGVVDEGKRRGAFKNGKEEGPWVYYYENGQLWAEGALLLGHTQMQTTQRYAHLMDAPVRDAAHTVGAALGGAFTLAQGGAGPSRYPRRR